MAWADENCRSQIRPDIRGGKRNSNVVHVSNSAKNDFIPHGWSVNRLGNILIRLGKTNPIWFNNTSVLPATRS